MIRALNHQVFSILLFWSSHRFGFRKKIKWRKGIKYPISYFRYRNNAQMWTFETILINLLISVTVCPTRKFLRMMRIQRSNWCRSGFIILNKTLQTKVFTTIQNDNSRVRCNNLILIYSKNNLRVLPNVSAQLEAHE